VAHTGDDPLANQFSLEFGHDTDHPEHRLPIGVVGSRLSRKLTGPMLNASNSAIVTTR
jgi:hypothetical protein